MSQAITKQESFTTIGKMISIQKVEKVFTTTQKQSAEAYKSTYFEKTRICYQDMNIKKNQISKILHRLLNLLKPASNIFVWTIDIDTSL